MRFQPAAYGLALVTAAVVLPFQIPRILQQRDWNAGTDRVMGHIDEMIISKRLTEVHYSYEVDGKPYKGVDFDTVFVEGTPAWVTYARSNPHVSSVVPESMHSTYVVSCVMAIVGLLPLAIMLVLEVVTWRKRSQQTAK